MNRTRIYLAYIGTEDTAGPLLQEHPSNPIYPQFGKMGPGVGVGERNGAKMIDISLKHPL